MTTNHFHETLLNALNFAKMNSPVKIFIVYARADAAYKDELVKALSPLKNQGWVASWHDGNIQPGQVWGDEIQQNLNAADVIVPLISNDFFASEYIQQVEIRHAFERYAQGDCTIIPVIVRACAWESDDRLARLQALPTDGKPIGSWANRDEAYQSVVTGIRRIVRPDEVHHHASAEVNPSVPLPRKAEKTAQGQKIQPYLKTMVVAAVVVAIAAFFFPHFGCPGQASPDALEQKAFLQAMEAGTIPALATFRREHPNGFRAAAAQQQLQKLQIRFDSCLASARALHRGGEKAAAQKAAASASQINPDDPRLKIMLQELDK